jgi:hypothetical protein
VPQSFDDLVTAALSIACPYCGAKHGEPCEKIDDSLELIHFERIEATKPRGGFKAGTSGAEKPKKRVK